MTKNIKIRFKIKGNDLQPACHIYYGFSNCGEEDLSETFPNSDKRWCKNRSSHLGCSIKRACNFIKKRLWHKCVPVNFAKFLRTPFLRTP